MCVRTTRHEFILTEAMLAHTQIGRLDADAGVWFMEVGNLVWKIIEVVGKSNESFAKAVRNAVEETGKTVKQMQWFEATQFRGSIKGNEVSEFQAVVKIGFEVER
jgi:flavin-binding protein dodecin